MRGRRTGRPARPPPYNRGRWPRGSAGGDASRTIPSGTRSRSRWGSSPRWSLVAGGIAAAWAINIYNSAPPLSSLKPVQKGRSSAIYAADGSLIGFIRSENIRQPLPEQALPQVLRDATIAIEDKNFYEHGALDSEGIARAAWKDLQAGGKPVQGASTITQQLVRNLYIQQPGRHAEAKADRSPLAVELEEAHDKGWILTQYLNTRALRDGRRPDRGRRRGGRADLLLQAGQGPRT